MGTALENDTEFLKGQVQVLERVAIGAPLDETIADIIRLIEAQESGLNCAVLVVAGDAIHFRDGAETLLSPADRDAPDGASIQELYRSACSQAAKRAGILDVPDIANDPAWSSWGSAAASAGLRSCRSFPVLGAHGEVLAAFAMYYDRVGDLSSARPEVIAIASHLTAIAVERDRSLRRLRDSEAQLERELEAAKQLQEISSRMVQENDVSALHDSIIDAAMALMDSDAASMQLLDQQSEALQLLAWKGFHPEAAAYWRQVMADSASTCGKALMSGRRLVTEDVEACAFMRGTGDLEPFRKSGLRAVQSTPLLSRSGRLLGMLSTHWRRPRVLTEAEARSMDVLARQAADLLERTQGKAALAESEASLRHIIDSAWEYAIITLDPEGRITSWNAGAVRILGYDQTEILGKSVDILFTPEDRAQGAPAREQRKAHTEGRAANERWHLRKDGSRFWGSGVMLRLNDKTMGTLKIFRDRTDERRAEERQQVLINELNHRVKNTLATVQAIATQTFRGGEVDVALLEAFQSRLVALARGHDILTRQSWERADLREVVASALEPFRAHHEDRLSVQGPALALTPSMVLALTLILHELGTNAMKYGALSNDTGQVEVAWSLDGKQGGGLRFRWQEWGGPPVTEPTHKGFGSRLIERSLRSDLAADSVITYCKEGLLLEFAIPLSRLEDAPFFQAFPKPPGPARKVREKD